MTVTFIDPPGELANTSEPIDFTTSRLVTSISVEYNPHLGNGAREAVWDGTSDADDTGGDFSYLFRASERTGAGPYAWTVRRAGKWPANFRIRVKEAAAPVAPPTTFWSVIYEANLKTFANQTLATDPGNVLDFTLDGQPWWLHTTGLVQIVNGTGMNIKGTNPTSPGNSYAGSMVGLRVHEMAAYDPAKMVCMQVRFNQPVGDEAAVGVRMHTGGGAFGSPATGMSNMGIMIDNNLQYVTSAYSVNYVRGMGLTYPGSLVPHDQFCFAMMAAPYVSPAGPSAGSARWDNWRMGLWTTDLVGDAWPAIEDMMVYCSSNNTGSGENPNVRMAAYMSGINGITPRTRTLTGIRILQRAQP